MDSTEATVYYEESISRDLWPSIDTEAYKYEHFELSSFSKMQVDLAAQVSELMVLLQMYKHSMLKFRVCVYVYLKFPHSFMSYNYLCRFSVTPLLKHYN